MFNSSGVEILGGADVDALERQIWVDRCYLKKMSQWWSINVETNVTKEFQMKGTRFSEIQE